MRTASLNSISASTLQPWVNLFICFHIIIWTVAPVLIRFTLPMDALEGTIWGHQLEWGYDKNPFMNGWLTALAIFLDPSGNYLYLFSQLIVGLCFWTVWEFGKKIAPPLYAFISVLILASLQYFNLHAIDFNDNTLELGFWSATILFFYNALQQNKVRDWLLTGLFAACSLMTKYYSILLLTPMFLFMLCHLNTRAHFKKYPFYVGLLLFLVIITPHIIWLCTHDFITVNYAVNRVTSLPHLKNHFIFPIKFAVEQFEVFIPAAVLLIILMSGKVKEKSTLSISSFDRNFLLAVGLGPFLLTLLLSAVTGIKLRAGWGQPLLTYWSLMILIWLSPSLTKRQVKRFLYALFFLMIALCFFYCVALIRADESSSANFPGKHIAKTLEQEWHQQFHTPLKYVIGPRWTAGNIAFYSSDRPSVYMEANKAVSPWIDEAKLQREGGIFVWDPAEADRPNYAELKKRFIHLGPQKIYHFAWLRNKKMAPVELSIAFLPPRPLL